MSLRLPPRALRGLVSLALFGSLLTGLSGGVNASAATTPGSIRTNLAAGVQFSTQVTALTEAFTVEGWWKWADGVSPAWGQLLLGGSGTPGIYLTGNNSLKLTRWGGGYDSSNCTLQNSFVAGSWYHLAIGRSSGGLVTVWVNGSPLQNCSKITVAPFTNLGTNFPTFFGGNGAGALFDGFFANYRATATDIYGAADARGFQPNSNFYTSITGTINLLNTPNDGAIVFSDSIGSPTGFTSHTGGTLSSEFPTYTPQSICFDGTQSKYFNTETIGTGDFTAELWVKPTVNVRYESFIDLGLNRGGSYLGYDGDGGNRIMFYDGGLGGGNNLVPLNTWTHIAVVRSSTLLKMFINGTEANRSANHNKNFTYTKVHIGSYGQSVANYIGCMASVRVVKSAVYSANFTPASVGSFPALPNAVSPLVSLLAGGNALYNSGTAGSVQGTGTLSYEALQIPQSVLTMSAASGTYGSTTTLTTTGGSGSGAVSFDVVSGNCSVAGDVLSATSAGNCVVTATKASDGTYGSITSAQSTIVISDNSTISYSGGTGATGTLPSAEIKLTNETFTVRSDSGITKTGYTFAHWSNGISSFAPGSIFTVGATDETLTAQWTLNNYVVTFLSGSNGSISGTNPQNIAHGANSSQVTAVPDANYHFVTWSDASTVNPRIISSVETTTSLSATFAIDTYTATYNSGGNGSISGTAVQTINHGETATAVTAIPSSNYHFLSWNDGVLTATRLDAAITGSISKTASFAIDAHAITFNANGGSGGSTVSVNYNENAIALAPTVAKSQYTFAGWAETVTATSINSWSVVGSKTLYSLWTPKVYTITYLPESGTALTAIETFTVGSAPIQLQSATRAGYKFNGWYTDKTGGSLLGISGANYTPTDTATVHAQWTQASLVGLSSPTSFGTIVATSGNDGGISATRSGTKAEIDYFADSLPDNTVITAYLQGSTAYAASQLTGVTNLLLSVVVAWKAPDETVPVVDPAKSAIRLKITNAGIKRGAKVYSIAGDSSTILTTATQDGFVVIELREDPEIVIANPVEVPAPPAPPTPPAPTPPSITAAPIVDNSAAENAAKLKAEEEAKKAAELKAAQEQATKDLQAAREKADAEIKAAQDAADLDAKLKVEADARLAADLKAKEDAEIAAKLASQMIVPDVTLYSISPTLKLSVYDTTYLKSYVATLKPKATVTCIGYIYPKNTTLTKAKLKATSQATAVCKLIKAQRKSLTTKVVIYPATKAPKAAAGAKWVAVSYRVDGFKS
jgi:uncharacterized repeat protein (TIGR02543 family)